MLLICRATTISLKYAFLNPFALHQGVHLVINGHFEIIRFPLGLGDQSRTALEGIWPRAYKSPGVDLGGEPLMKQASHQFEGFLPPLPL